MWSGVRTLYKKLLTFYPRQFRDQLGESMEQTFHDLYKEQKHQPTRAFFVLSIFAETAMGIVREHVLLITEGATMKAMLANPRSAAVTGFLLCLPLAVPYLILIYDIKPLIGSLNNLLTIDGQQINNLGRIVIFGGLLLLPIAFVLNLRPMLKRDGTEGKRKLYVLNLIVGAIILLFIIMTWGSLIMESIYCLRGIRCD